MTVNNPAERHGVPTENESMANAWNGLTVLITGVNGYIATWTAKKFLDGGYNVRGTARSAETSLSLLKGAFSAYIDEGRLSIVEVSDITATGAFDEAVQGCHAIAHLASPIAPDFHDPEPVMRTAVRGTQSILESAHKLRNGTLKAFVLLSSIAAVTDPTVPESHRYTEEDWNDFSEKEVERLGKETPSGHIYAASKTAAERALWQFRHDKSPAFTCTAINPVFVWGPALVLPQDLEKLNLTLKAIWTIFSGQDIPPPLGGSGGCVDVRDVARLVFFAVQHKDVADGQRYIACGGQRSEQSVVDILRAHYPSRRDIIKAGTPGVGYSPDFGFDKFDTSKAVHATGQGWIGCEQSVLDAAGVFERYL